MYLLISLCAAAIQQKGGCASVHTRVNTYRYCINVTNSSLKLLKKMVTQNFIIKIKASLSTQNFKKKDDKIEYVIIHFYQKKKKKRRVYSIVTLLQFFFYISF